MGSGGAFFDADGDGWLDVFLVNSRDWTPRAGRRSLSALYRNTGAGKFTDITTGSGLDVEMYGMGVAAADYDNDGRQDLYVTALEGDRLFQNLGSGKFKDVTKAAGIANANFGTSAAWLDYDRDGHVDLFVANYVQWTAQDRPLVLAGWRREVVLHARVVQGHGVEAVPQSRRREVRGREREGRPRRSDTASRSGSPCSTTTWTAGPTCLSPTTRSRTSCIATTATALSPRKAYRPGSRSAKTASRAARWASMPPTTIARAVRI